ncbi:ABC transporter permease [Paenibacillus sp. JCM 10914]|uniref:ABC transporter permease n=1 Tax=Paenibacillus sp. JCM 10914 TaxID=1236974 RepID=UPI0003CC86C7|nr:ABC transporter permease [Paenibacillus sp. JCM 10914]GAE07217.1 putative glutathione transporter, permease component [Paenibacillus sp. JCM 10914]
MKGTEAAARGSLISTISRTYSKILLNPSYRYLLLLLGAPVNIVVFLFYVFQRRKDDYVAAENAIRSRMLAEGYLDRLRDEVAQQQRRKHLFFKQKIGEQQLKHEVETIVKARFQEALRESTHKELQLNNQKRLTMADTFAWLIEKPLFFIISLIPGLFMYILIFLYGNPYLKYILERLVMTIFVIFGVAVLVFTILHLSPFNPAANILGETATTEQIANFNRMHGLDQNYITQLWNNIKGIAYFDLGKSFSGNEDITSSIARKFPITLTLTVVSLIIAIAIALPIGIISATRPNSFFDYSFMFVALLGLSIPNFWQGLIFILNFSIKLQWLPATFNPQNWLSMIMPVIVLGTGLTASVARMTRSSTLEVINEDYMITARAKGLTKRTVLMKHAVRNAIIPIITVIGLQFGGMLGGSAVTEKVFNISGIGSYIVDKQFIPDIPAIMGGVVYTAITISLVNVIIDILYAFFDPRIRSKMKQY